MDENENIVSFAEAADKYLTSTGQKKPLESSDAGDYEENPVEAIEEEGVDGVYEDTALEADAESEAYEFPEALANVRVKYFIVGGLVIAFAIGFTILMREIRILPIALFGLWFIYNGWALKQKYLSGKILAAVLICTSVHSSNLKDVVTVGFRTDDEVPSFYQFKLAGKKRADDFIPNGTYIVYFYEETPSQLLAYSAV